MITSHIMMLGDEVRNLAFRQAIFEVVRNGDVVLDLGAGTGLLGFFALQGGAGKLYLVEGTSVIFFAKAMAEANMFSDKVLFIQKPSWRVELPEKVDVIIAEMLGQFALEEDIVRYLADARRRFLKPDGTIIPIEIELFVVPVESPENYEFIDSFNILRYGIDFKPIKTMAVGHIYTVAQNPKGFLSSPQQIGLVSLSRDQNIDDFSLIKNNLSFKIIRSGICHGLVGWFIAKLSPNIELSTSPLKPITHWGHAFMPILQPLSLKEGGEITVEIVGSAMEGLFIWQWQVSYLGKVYRSRSIYRCLEPISGNLPSTENF